MKVSITFTFCYDNVWKSKFVALEKPGKLGNFYCYFVATLLQFQLRKLLLLLLHLAKCELSVKV